MKVRYSTDVDILRITFKDSQITESDENIPGVIVDYDEDGNIVALEILDASARLEDPMSCEYKVA